MKQIIILFLGLLALVACKKTETPAPTTPPSSGGTTTTYGDLQTLYIQKLAITVLS